MYFIILFIHLLSKKEPSGTEMKVISQKILVSLGYNALPPRDP